MPRSSGLDGILLIDKPAGWTSHDVVARARRLTGQRRIGHTGTLDPMATGLLVLCLGNATRLVEYMAVHDKSYQGEVRLGVTTDTDDADGTVTATAPVPPLTGAMLAELTREFTGALDQLPPAYSAVKVAGRRAYAVARGGEMPALQTRPVSIHRLKLQLVEPDSLTIAVACGPGTYVRSLARDIGARLGCGGHLKRLRRTAVGAFSIGNAISLEALKAAVGSGSLDAHLLACDDGITAQPAAILAEGSAAAFSNGIVLEPQLCGASRAGPLRVYSASGSFSGIARVDQYGQLRPLKVFKSTD